MKLPGRGWLELSVGASADGGSYYLQRALFEPRGLTGQIYWKATAPFHAVVFGGMARNIIAVAQRSETSSRGSQIERQTRERTDRIGR